MAFPHMHHLVSIFTDNNIDRRTLSNDNDNLHAYRKGTVFPLCRIGLQGLQLIVQDRLSFPSFCGHSLPTPDPFYFYN